MTSYKRIVDTGQKRYMTGTYLMPQVGQVLGEAGVDLGARGCGDSGLRRSWKLQGTPGFISHHASGFACTSRFLHPSTLQPAHQPANCQRALALSHPLSMQPGIAPDGLHRHCIRRARPATPSRLHAPALNHRPFRVWRQTFGSRGQQTAKCRSARDLEPD